MEDVVNSLAKSAAEKRAFMWGNPYMRGMMMNPYMGGMGYGRFGRMGMMGMPFGRMGMMGAPMMYRAGPGGMYMGMDPRFAGPMAQRMQLMNLGMLPEMQGRAQMLATLGQQQAERSPLVQHQLGEAAKALAHARVDPTKDIDFRQDVRREVGKEMADRLERISGKIEQARGRITKQREAMNRARLAMQEAMGAGQADMMSRARLGLARGGPGAGGFAGTVGGTALTALDAGAGILGLQGPGAERAGKAMAAQRHFEEQRRAYEDIKAQEEAAIKGWEREQTGFRQQQQEQANLLRQAQERRKFQMERARAIQSVYGRGAEQAQRVGGQAGQVGIQHLRTPAVLGERPTPVRPGQRLQPAIPGAPTGARPPAPTRPRPVGGGPPPAPPPPGVGGGGGPGVEKAAVQTNVGPPATGEGVTPTQLLAAMGALSGTYGKPGFWRGAGRGALMGGGATGLVTGNLPAALFGAGVGGLGGGVTGLLKKLVAGREPEKEASFVGNIANAAASISAEKAKLS